jgi:DNA-binding FrmR family transcriptional regulator
MEDKHKSTSNLGSLKHEEALKTLRIAKGHLNGIEKMIEENKYCIDISKQILAVIALLRKANGEVLKKHLETCVKDAIATNQIDKKLRKLKK